MLDLEQCPFCNGKLEIATLNCPSGGTPCYCFRCTKCGGIRRFGTLNPADICRECELSQKVQQLERRCSELSIEVVSAWEQNRALKQAGDEMEHCLSLIIKSYAENIITRDAIKAWQKAKEESE